MHEVPKAHVSYITIFMAIEINFTHTVPKTHVPLSETAFFKNPKS